MVDCDTFVTLGVRYRHNATTNSPDRDFLALVAEILDGQGNVVKREYFQVLDWRRMKNASENVAIFSGVFYCYFKSRFSCFL